MSAITVVEPGEIAWSFTDHPQIRYSAWRGSAIDPTPAYAHELELVRAEADRLERICPPNDDLQISVYGWEDMGRTNGFSDRAHSRRQAGERPRWAAHIVLSGKRIPPHPAVTRYVVAHEYGHQVEWWIERALGYWEPPDHGRVIREYGAYRGLPPQANHYGPGLWHLNWTEVFADDFRIVVADRESEYWPHAGIPHPYEVDKAAGRPLTTWWAWAEELLRQERRELAA